MFKKKKKQFVHIDLYEITVKYVYIHWKFVYLLVSNWMCNWGGKYVYVFLCVMHQFLYTALIWCNILQTTTEEMKEDEEKNKWIPIKDNKHSN